MLASLVYWTALKGVFLTRMATVGGTRLRDGTMRVVGAIPDLNVA
jgi:hypothetical protein